MPRARFAAAVLAVVVALFLSSVGLQAQTAPALNNILDLTHVITDADPTTLRSIKYLGEHERHMWLIRDGRWAPDDYPAHVFDVDFSGLAKEFQVDVEIGDQAAARAEVDTYAPIFGRLPWALLEGIDEVEIQVEGGSSMSAAPPFRNDPSGRMISVSTARVEATDLVSRGFAEEYAIHEAAHASWDPTHIRAPGWLAAQEADPAFVSRYARDYPDREDLADTAVAWFAVRYRPDRISPGQHQAILDAIPNRLAYFDRQGFDMSPYVRAAPVPALPLGGLATLGALLTVAAWRARRRRPAARWAR